MTTSLLTQWLSGTQKDLIRYLRINPGLTIEVTFDPDSPSDKPPGATVQRYMFRVVV